MTADEARKQRRRFQEEAARAGKAQQHGVVSQQTLGRERARLQRKWVELAERRARTHGVTDKALATELLEVREALDAVPGALAAEEAATDAAHRGVQGAQADLANLIYGELETFLADQDERAAALQEKLTALAPLYQAVRAEWAAIAGEYEALAGAMVDRTSDIERSRGRHRDRSKLINEAAPEPCPLPPWPGSETPEPAGVAKFRQLLADAQQPAAA